MVEESIRELLREKLGSEFNEDTFNALIPLLDKGRCRIAVIRKMYFDLIPNNTGEESKYIVSEEVGVSTDYVNKCVYKHRSINIFG
jgi:hypothetical protein